MRSATCRISGGFGLRGECMLQAACREVSEKGPTKQAPTSSWATVLTWAITRQAGCAAETCFPSASFSPPGTLNVGSPQPLGRALLVVDPLEQKSMAGGFTHGPLRLKQSTTSAGASMCKAYPRGRDRVGRIRVWIGLGNPTRDSSRCPVLGQLNQGESTAPDKPACFLPIQHIQYIIQHTIQYMMLATLEAVVPCGLA
ncbi:hypothetical protein LX36DRAFT_31305 [Colletotrichum falcatum]|nr:hypothetical protein LX36DRAFT_31305 [Colletotrichum falcatum]